MDMSGSSCWITLAIWAMAQILNGWNMHWEGVIPSSTFQLALQLLVKERVRTNILSNGSCNAATVSAVPPSLSTDSMIQDGWLMNASGVALSLLHTRPPPIPLHNGWVR